MLSKDVREELKQSHWKVQDYLSKNESATITTITDDGELSKVFLQPNVAVIFEKILSMTKLIYCCQKSVKIPLQNKSDD